LGTRISMTSYA